MCVWYLDGGPLEIIWYGDQVQSVCEDLWLLGFSYLFLDSCLCFTLSSLHVNLFWVYGSLAFSSRWLGLLSVVLEWYYWHFWLLLRCYFWTYTLQKCMCVCVCVCLWDRMCKDPCVRSSKDPKKSLPEPITELLFLCLGTPWKQRTLWENPRNSGSFFISVLNAI